MGSLCRSRVYPEVGGGEASVDLHEVDCVSDRRLFRSVELRRRFFFALLSFHIFSLRREIVRIHIDCVTLSEILENTELHGNLFRSSGESGRIIL